jgi:hypothetical protein
MAQLLDARTAGEVRGLFGIAEEGYIPRGCVPFCRGIGRIDVGFCVGLSIGFVSEGVWVVRLKETWSTDKCCAPCWAKVYRQLHRQLAVEFAVAFAAQRWYAAMRHWVFLG